MSISLNVETLSKLGFFIANSGLDRLACRNAVLCLQETLSLRVTGIVDPRTHEMLAECVRRDGETSPHGRVVRGYVRSAEGNPLVRIEIRAFDRDLRHEQPLGHAVTDASGRYEIVYTAAQFRRAEKGHADLIVRAYRDERMVAESAISFDAPEVALVNLVIGVAITLSEWELVTRAIDPVLDGAARSSLTTSDVDFLTHELGLPGDEIVAWATAHRLAATLHASAVVLYALFREAVPQTLDALLAQPKGALLGAAQRALDRRIVPASARAEVDSTLAAIAHAALVANLDASSPSAPALGRLLHGVLPEDAARRAFAELLGAQPHSGEAFWAAAAARPSLQASIPRLQFLTQLTALTGVHPPLVDVLLERAESLEELARLPRSEWISLIEETGAPESVPAANPAERVQIYAGVIDRMLEDAAPSSRITARLADAGDAISSEAASFLDATRFDLRGGSLRQYLADNPNSTLGDGARAHLETVQRVFKITPRFDEIKMLMSNGVISAPQLAATPPPQVALMMKSAVDGARALAIHESASRQVALAMVLEAGLDPRINDSGVVAIQVPRVDKVSHAELRTLFGSLDYCACEECQSVDGPAAYLVDLLALLGTQQASDGETAYQKLLARRPDIKRIPLSCHNTNTVLPYIDLANEILEVAAVTQLGAKPQVFEFDTRGEAPDLALAPEHLTSTVYEADTTAPWPTLADQKFPLSLPFDLAAETIRASLSEVGVTRARLLEVFRPLHTMGMPSETDQRAAREYLGMPKLEWDLVTGTVTASDAELWGTPTDLTRVSEFLLRSELAITELYQLLDSAYATQWGALAITPAGACKTEDMHVAWPAQAPVAIARFLRLRRRLGLSIADLDRLLDGLGAKTITATTIVDIWRIARWRERFRLDWSEVLAWVAPVSRRSFDGSPALYDRLFNQPAPGGAPVLAARLADAAPRLLSALQISAADFELLCSNADSEIAGTATDHDNLSRLFRAASLARALRLAIPDLLQLKRLLGMSWPDRTTEPLEALIHAADRFSASGLKVAEAVWLLTDIDSVEHPVATPVDAIATVLQEICVSLRQAASRITLDAQSTGDVVNGTFAGTVTAEATRTPFALLLGADAAVRMLSLLAGSRAALTPDDRNFIATALAFYSGALNDLFDSGARTTLEQRLAVVMPKLQPELYNRLAEEAIVQALSRATRIDRSRALAILVDVPGFDPSSKSLRDDFKPLAMLDPAATIDATKVPYAMQAFRLVERLALLSRRLVLKDEELDLIIAPPSHVAWISAAALSHPNTAGTLQSLLTTAGVVTMRRKLLGRNGMLSDVLTKSDTDVDGAIAELAARAGWSPTNAAKVRARLGAEQPTDYPSGEAFLRVRDAMEALQQLGAAMEDVTPLLASEPTLADGEAARSLARAKFDSETWKQKGKAIQDRLREARRDALVAYLSSSPLMPASKLFERFLIDVEMSHCQQTSRIKAAIGSLQLFIQRCLMNLEVDDQVGIQLDPDVATWWRWMQNYRVWQGNRKVFLFPENWIEPELRDDKTPQFAKLESALSQQDVTEAVVDDAFLAYLEEVHKIARLEVMAVFHDTRDVRGGDFGALHVLARTWSTPHTYYYRQRMGLTRWTAWEKLDADIEDDRVMLVVHDNHPVVVWPSLKQQNDPAHPAPKEEPPNLRWEIRFYWVERRHGKWGAKRATDPNYPTYASSSIKSNDFVFRAFDRDGRLFVKPYHLMPPGPDVGPWVVETAEIELTTCNGRLYPTTLQPSADDGWPWFYMDGTGFQIRNDNLYYGGYANQYRPFAVLDGEVPDGASREDVADLVSPIALFDEIPSSHWVAADRQTEQFTAIHPFVFQDRTRTYLFEPFQANDVKWQTTRLIDPNRIAKLPGMFHLALAGGDPVGPVIRAVQPMLAAVQPVRAAMHLVTAPAPASDAPRMERTAAKWDPTKLIRLQPTVTHFLCSTFHHPLVCELMHRAESEPLDKLLSLETQQLGSGRVPFDAYKPNTDRIDAPYPLENIDFERRGAYSIYNWELFFHAPFLLAVRLMQNERYEEALSKLELIFDPTSGASGASPGVERFWKFQPFYEAALHPEQSTQPIQDLLAVLGSDQTANAVTQMELIEQIDAYRDNPFNPHLLARLRPVAYQKAVVMRYLDCLIGRGDQLFQRNTIESINQATLLYVRAANIMGPRPHRIPKRTQPQAKAFEDLGPTIGKLEATLPQGSGAGAKPRAPLPIFDATNFCVPANDKLLAYWDTIADRLFKIRHCQNIEGQLQQLPLFEPPIDPALLVRAASAGVDVGSVLNDLSTPLPSYRFAVIVQKAEELCADVRALGSTFLSILEKHDAEALSLMRSDHEVAMLDAVREVRRSQAEESRHALRALHKQRETVEFRRAHYLEVLQYMNPREQKHVQAMSTAAVLQLVQGELETLAGVLHAIPNFNLGASGIASPVVTTIWGGHNLGSMLQAVARGIGIGAQVLTFESTLASTMGSFDRRREEWTFQGQTAGHELAQLDEQILAAELRVAITQKELDNHELQREQARDVNALMRSKFTSSELFDWMVRQAGNAYQEAFQLAYEMAKRAERCYQFERAAFDRVFVGPAYWDNLRQGLLAGEKLHHDLRRMEVAYLDDNRRDLEITKHVSLALLDPTKLVALRETGSCDIELSEAYFDLDLPGHYLRRIKSVALTIPAVVGPHTSLNAKLTLVESAIRISNSAAGYTRDTRTAAFRTLQGGLESIVTSTGQNDFGVFEPNLRDERYLPFEGAGAVSKWRLELPLDTNLFDFESISDVLLHLRYTARDGGSDLKTAAQANMPDSAGARLYSGRHDFGTGWAAFAHPPAAQDGQWMELDFTQRLPRARPGTQVQLASVGVFFKVAPELVADVNKLKLRIAPSGQTPAGTAVAVDKDISGLPYVTFDLGGSAPARWTLWLAEGDIPPALQGPQITDANGKKHTRLDDTLIEDVGFVLAYAIS